MTRRAWIPIALVAGALLWPAGWASAGTVKLLNDEEIEGEILDVGIDYVVIRIPGGRQSIPLREVRDVEFRSGESMWEKKLKDALARAKAQKDAERAARAAREMGDIKKIVPIGNTSPTAPAPVPVAISGLPPSGAIDISRLGGTWDDERLFMRFPGSFQPNKVDGAYTTFKDGAGTQHWTFNITFFNGRDEGDYDAIRGRAQNELERIPLYKARQRLPISVGKRAGERTVGLYERNGRAVRHDQLVLPAANGVLVIHFFSPGATMDEGGVPDVEAVIKTIQLK